MKIKLTKFVEVECPSTPNFIRHKTHEENVAVPISLFSEAELKKIGKAWTSELIRRAKLSKEIKK